MDRKAVLATTLTLMLISILTLGFDIRPVKSDWPWTETIYIRADGSVYPDTAPISSVDNITYTLIDNIIGDVPDWVSAIVVERDNVVVDGAGYTVRGTGRRGTGIRLTGKSNVTIKNMTIEGFYGCIRLRYSSNNSICRNNITNNTFGVLLYPSSNNTISGNNIINNHAGINSFNSSGNTISGNNINNHADSGIRFYKSSGNTISGNNITNSRAGVMLDTSCNNTVSGDNITNGFYGVYLTSSSNNTFSENNIVANNYRGVFLYTNSSDNKFYHNNFIDNTKQVHFFTSGYANFWDDNYPSGGNYWSDHVTVDDYSGVNQDEPGSDGIVDEPYIIDEYNRDNYPLVEPWSPVISATIDVDPDILNLRSRGKWITAYIQLPEEHNAEDINATTILLNGTISPVLDPRCEFVTNSSEYLVDYNEDGILERMVKFDKAEVMALLGVGEVSLTITGEVNGTPYQGSDSIRVICPSTGCGGCKGFKK